MSWRFRRSFKLFPGIRVNLGKRGASWSFGRRGFTYTIGKSGTRTTVGIPGTGISHTSYKKYNTKSPLLPTTSQVSTAQPKRSGLFFFILGASVLGFGLLGSLLNLGNTTNPSHSIQTSEIGSTPSIKPPPAIKEPQPPSENYVPPNVTLTSPISLPIFESGVQTGIRSIPIGTKVNLEKIKGIDVEINYDGQSKKIPNISTDLLPRMLGTSTPTPTQMPASIPAPLFSIEFKNGAIYYGHLIIKSPTSITLQVHGNNIHKIPASLLTEKTVKELALDSSVKSR